MQGSDVLAWLTDLEATFLVSVKDLWRSDSTCDWRFLKLSRHLDCVRILCFGEYFGAETRRRMSRTVDQAHMGTALYCGRVLRGACQTHDDSIACRRRGLTVTDKESSAASIL